VRRGELYLVRKRVSLDPKRQRVFVVVSRQVLIDSNFSTVICAPVYSRHDGLSTQVRIGPEDGMKKESSVHCDELVSLPKNVLTHYVGTLGAARIEELNLALATALELKDRSSGYRASGTAFLRM
jgi:mRNA interferase MazF